MAIGDLIDLRRGARMYRRSLLVLAFLLLAVSLRAEEPKARDLFNGKDLDGWVVEGPKTSTRRRTSTPPDRSTATSPPANRRPRPRRRGTSWTSSVSGRASRSP